MRTTLTALAGTILLSLPVCTPVWASDTTPHQLVLNLPSMPHWKTETVIDTHKAQFGQVSDTTETFAYDSHATPKTDGFVVSRTLQRQDLKTSGMDMSAIMLGDRQKAYRRDLSHAIGNISYTTDNNLLPLAILDWDAVKTKMRVVSVTYLGDMGARTFDDTIGQSTPEAAAGSYLTTQTDLDGLYAAPLQLNTPVVSETTLPAVLMNTSLKATQTLTLTRWDTLMDRAEYRLDIKPDPEALTGMMRQFISQMMLHFDPMPGYEPLDAKNLAENSKPIEAFVATTQFNLSTTCRIAASIKTGMVTKNRCDTQVNISLPPAENAAHTGRKPGIKIANTTRFSVTQTLLP